MDRLTPERRSWLMSRVKPTNTSPELRVRSAAPALGLRFRLHAKNLPGRPDLVFPKWKKVIFVHGCFWHRHPGCKKATKPKSRTDYWSGKFARNVERDREVEKMLTDMGWSVHTIWECETKDLESLNSRLLEIFELVAPCCAVAKESPSTGF